MDTVTLKINGMTVTAPKGSTILEAARLAGIDIPTLCFLKEINEIGACRICVVEVKGARSLVASCVYPVNEGMEVFTNTPKVLDSRRKTLQLILSNHERKCLSCVRSTTCELQKLCNEYGVDETRFSGEKNVYKIDDATPIIRDNNKCILCRRCVAACKNVQGIGVIGANDRGSDTHIGSIFEKSLSETSCINCGQCIVACPVGALYERDDTDKILDAIADPGKHVLICTAPSVRAQIGECFGYEPGTDCEGKMVAALKALGFDGVYDMNLTADLTIMEEATEFLGRVKNGGALPMITSCSPGWIKYCEHYFPDFVDNLSTCKSPQQMFGAVVKTYYAEKMGWDPKDIFFVSAIPCTAKKFEVGRPGQSAAGVPDVDVAITTREVGKMISKAGIDFKALDDAIAAAEVGKEVEITIPCENAAGPKNPKLIETYPLKDFTKQEINPYPGLPVNLGNRTGIVLPVGAGRVKVDFNNQLAGHDLMYRFTVIEEVTDAVAKAKAVLEMNVGNADGFEFDIQDDKVVVTESEMCKFNQNWMIAKYKIVTELRDIFGVGRIDFVQVWDANQKI